MKNKSQLIAIRVTEKDKKLIEEAAEKESRTISDFCRLIILEAIKKDAGK